MAPRPNRYRMEAAALNRVGIRQPALRPRSVRRTSSLQCLWTPGEDRKFDIAGRARDVANRVGRGPSIIGEDSIDAVAGLDGRLLTLGGSRREEALARFGGLRAGGELRKAMARDVGDEARSSTRLHRLLDDLAGATFMSMGAWYAWEGGLAGHAERVGAASITQRPVAGLCLSFVPGSPAMTGDGQGDDENADHPLGPLPVGGDDPGGFHALVEVDGPNQWRLRRTDLWREGGELVADVWFQDSSAVTGDSARRVIFHEYGLVARFNADTQTLTAIAVTPYVLPYTTCHAAPATADVLIGRNVREFSSLVLTRLKGEAGCTHLNDMLRSLQDVAGLVDDLALTDVG